MLCCRPPPVSICYRTQNTSPEASEHSMSVKHAPITAQHKQCATSVNSIICKLAQTVRFQLPAFCRHRCRFVEPVRDEKKKKEHTRERRLVGIAFKWMLMAIPDANKLYCCFYRRCTNLFVFALLPLYLLLFLFACARLRRTSILFASARCVCVQVDAWSISSHESVALWLLASKSRPTCGRAIATAHWKCAVVCGRRLRFIKNAQSESDPHFPHNNSESVVVFLWFVCISAVAKKRAHFSRKIPFALNSDGCMRGGDAAKCRLIVFAHFRC